jgi:hypothetical protein
MFRTTSGDDEHQLIERVLVAMLELEIDGAGVSLTTRGVRVSTDSDGTLVLADVVGPPGWHYHAGPIMDRHALRCSVYAA